MAPLGRFSQLRLASIFWLMRTFGRALKRNVQVLCGMCLLICASASAVVLAANGSVTYAYDALGRITAAAYDTGACITYTYDPVGNRLSETVSCVEPDWHRDLGLLDLG